MKLMKKRAALALACILLASCAAKQPVDMTPAQTAQFRAAQSLATVAELNRGITTSTIKLNQAGSLSNALTTDILGYCRQVAIADQLAVDLLASPEPWLTKAPKLLAYLDLLRKPASLANFNQPITNPALSPLAQSIGAMDTYIVAAKGAMK